MLRLLARLHLTIYLSKARVQSNSSQRLLNDTSSLTGDCQLCGGLLTSPEPFPHMAATALGFLFNYPGNSAVMTHSVASMY